MLDGANQETSIAQGLRVAIFSADDRRAVTQRALSLAKVPRHTFLGRARPVSAPNRVVRSSAGIHAHRNDALDVQASPDRRDPVAGRVVVTEEGSGRSAGGPGSFLLRASTASPSISGCTAKSGSRLRSSACDYPQSF
jgi:hypothetical protein